MSTEQPNCHNRSQGLDLHSSHRITVDTVCVCVVSLTVKYVVKHKSAKIFMTYAVGKLEAALNMSHLILGTSRVS